MRKYTRRRESQTQVIALARVIERFRVIELVEITPCGSARASAPLRAGVCPGGVSVC